MHFFHLKFQICTQVYIYVYTLDCVSEHSEYDWHKVLMSIQHLVSR